MHSILTYLKIITPAYMHTNTCYALRIDCKYAVSAEMHRIGIVYACHTCIPSRCVSVCWCAFVGLLNIIK
jgi:hypothetical protein